MSVFLLLVDTISYCALYLWYLWYLIYPGLSTRFERSIFIGIGFLTLSIVILKRVFKRGPGWLATQLLTTQSHARKSKSLLSYSTVYRKKYAHGFVVLCFVVVMQSFIMNSHEVFIHIHQGCFAGTGAIVRLPQCQWSKPDGYGKNQSMCNHNKAQQSKNRVHISWDILYVVLCTWFWNPSSPTPLIRRW